MLVETISKKQAVIRKSKEHKQIEMIHYKLYRSSIFKNKHIELDGESDDGLECDSSENV